MAKKTINGVVGLVGASTTNYIKQISDGTTAHDLALTKTISFFDGKDGDAIVWDGTQGIEVVIPSVTDIIQDPVRMVGTVGSTGALPANYTPAKGDLLYITNDCDFAGTDPATACEAGDMAIYDGNAWHVIQGENQVTIEGTPSNNVVTVNLSGTPVNVIDVEGTKLALGIDYDDVAAKTKVSKNPAMSLDVTGQTVVDSMAIGLTQTSGSTLDISASMSIALPSALASGAVTINESVLVADNFSWDAGTLPSATKNSSTITVTATHNMSIGKAGEDGATGDYVTGITALATASLAAGTSSDFAYVSGISAIEGTSFVSGIHAHTEADGNAAGDLVIPGAVSIVAADNTFVTGLSTTEGSTGDVLSSINVGTVSIAAGEGILTGTTTGTDFVTNVTFGTAVSNASQWFYSGLTEGSDVVTDVNLGTVSLVASTAHQASAMTTASVVDHVLTFSTANFMTPVDISVAGQSVSKKAFSKAGVELSGFDQSKAGFTTGSLSQAATTVSYKSFETASVSLTQGTAVSYYFDKAKDHAYTAQTGYMSIATTNATPTKNTPVLQNPTITASIAANTVLVEFSAGSLPSFSVGDATGTLTGSVDTTLSTSNVSWLAIDGTKMAATELAGAYSLTSASDTPGAIQVAAAGTYSLESGAEAALAANVFVTDVYVDGSAAGAYVAPTPQDNG